MKTNSIDLIIFGVYLLMVLAFGLSFYKKKRSAKGFTTGEGRLPTWTLGMSVFATYVSSISFLALPGNAFLKDWNGLVFSLSIPLAAFIAVKFFVPLYRKLDSESAYFFMEQRFGAWARIYASACYLLTQLARMGAILYLLALPMHTLMGWSIPSIIIFTGILVMVYATLGGIEAVVWTDAIQGIVLIVGAIICLVVLIIDIPGGFGGFIEVASEQKKFSLGELGISLTEPSFWLILIYGFFINLQNFGADQSYIQRYLGAKTDKDAAKSVWLGSLLYVPVSIMFFMIGTALWVYYQSFPELLPAGMASDKVFPHFIVNELPVGLTGLLIAAIFSAGMSTVSTSINSSATVLLSDYYRKFSKTTVSEKASIGFLRLSSLVMGLLSIVVALAFNGVTSALDTWWALASIFSGGILGLFLLGLLIKNITPRTALIAVAAGLVFILFTSLLPFFGIAPIIHSNWVVVFGTLLIFGIGWGLSKLKS
ncbi:sodium:solute symporter [Arcticibacterium luteifluviistationis]|uniref:Sodium:solute symporter n=1 Tax=Arcticibacterium luteifluviistationis TaxID=1784714 RepID=A0A2Z4G7G2_9BACT|nr:sodium:solute symporter [Arcticibacterium luteifluviistationis]AWV97023.1 sodium:solute symporter [Arcticibacterium luteifluviistationis]